MECAREGCSNERKSPRSKYCDDAACVRVRDREAQRRHRSGESAPSTAPAPVPSAGGAVFSASLAELTEAGRVHSSAGQVALSLAVRLDLGASDTGSSLAAVAKQHSAAMAEALRGAEAAVADPVDELRRRREARGA